MGKNYWDKFYIESEITYLKRQYIFEFPKSKVLNIFHLNKKDNPVNFSKKADSNKMIYTWDIGLTKSQKSEIGNGLSGSMGRTNHLYYFQ